MDKRHLDGHMAEIGFRYSNRSALGIENSQLADRLFKGVSGEQPTYKTDQN
jgi:hypothetical protein